MTVRPPTADDSRSGSSDSVTVLCWFRVYCVSRDPLSKRWLPPATYKRPAAEFSRFSATLPTQERAFSSSSSSMKLSPISNLPSNLTNLLASLDPAPAQDSVKIGTSVTEKAALSKPTGVKPVAPKVQDYINLIKLLMKNKIPFYIHPLDEERKIKAVVRSMPLEFQSDEVKNDLINQAVPESTKGPTHREPSGLAPSSDKLPQGSPLGKPRDLFVSYRPISLLSSLGTLRLSDHLIKKGLVIDTVAVFFDVANVFDRDWHTGLIHKLYTIEVSDRLDDLTPLTPEY
ncbi:hypothetical protein EVAR_11881_1 [Eumeta japonica]|uniref:Reverse transcriptase domain-containing protein n=1 Tax=Eumeta variegata TaxID=151549 RepID=A0A4C1U7L2_EUMVA|nr:hypothetical protein EVAR_11881_1 [Eumeta japonica]